MADLIFGKTPFFTMIVSAKASGKSEMCRFVVYTYARDFQYVVCICPTALNEFYDGFLPKAHIHSEYSDELVQKILEKQEGFKKSGKPCQMLLILDDILASPDVNFEKRKSSVLNKLFAANRHWGISILICTQKLKGLPRLCRDNVDFACLGRCMRSAWPSLFEEFGNTGKDSFYKMLSDGTRDYRFLRYKANVSSEREHFSCFSVPPDFLNRKFRLSY